MGSVKEILWRRKTGSEQEFVVTRVIAGFLCTELVGQQPGDGEGSGRRQCFRAFDGVLRHHSPLEPLRAFAGSNEPRLDRLGEGDPAERAVRRLRAKSDPAGNGALWPSGSSTKEQITPIPPTG